jgi:hypothetical protein
MHIAAMQNVSKSGQALRSVASDMEPPCTGAGSTKIRRLGLQEQRGPFGVIFERAE